LKPTYFPFTYVPQWVAETLAACFKQFTVYQPSGRKLPSEMQYWAEANVMEVRVPVRTDDEALAKVAKELRAFADLHDDSKNLKTAVLWGRQGFIPCFGESAVSRIVADLNKGSRTVSAEEDVDPLFYARVFLDFAQQFDRQGAELNRDLGANDRLSRDLLKEISDEKENGLPVTPLNAEIRIEDPTEYMASDRLQAWLRLFMAGPVDSGLFVTSSPAVFNHLIENLAGAQKVIEFEGLPVTDAKNNSTVTWRDSFLKQLKQLFENRGTAAEHAFDKLTPPEDRRSTIGLTLYMVSAQSPVDTFKRVLEDQNIDPRIAGQSAEAGSTLIGLIDRRPTDALNT
jgi:hypothetical protein